MLKGFKDFILRGNLVELAVAFIMAAAFATVVSDRSPRCSWTSSARSAAQPDFSRYAPDGSRSACSSTP